MSRLTGAIACLALLAFIAPASAQESEVPYWASIRAEVVNMRVGPGTSYPIEWVYRRLQLPVRVVRRKEGWRLVEDSDGTQGWMVARFLSRDRTAIVSGKGVADMRREASTDSMLMWRLEPGVVAKLRDCDEGWCQIEIRGHRGYVQQHRLWGPGEP